MKKVFWMLSAVTLAALTACSVKMASSSRRTGIDPLIVRAHFIGTEQLLASPDAAKLNELWSLKSSTALRNEWLTRAALLPSFWLGDVLPQGAPNHTNLFRPLLEDVLARESYLDANASPDFVLAVKASNDRAKLWQTNLWQALTGWNLGQPTAVQSGGASGFEIKRTGIPGVFRYLRAGEWIIVSAGTGNSAREQEFLAGIKASGRPAKPSGAWLDGAANLARFDGWLPALSQFQNLPIAHFSFSNRADFVRTHAIFEFPKAHGWKAEPWLIPTNQIHDPLISFIVARGIAPVLDGFKAFADLGIKPTPNQVTGWGYSSLPFQFNYALPSKDAREKIKPLAPRLANVIQGPHRTNFTGNINLASNGQEIVWTSLPVAAPRAGALRDSGNEYLAMAMFPSFRTTNPPPPGLFQSLGGRNDLVAFDFEITSMRIPHWRQIYQLAEIASRRPVTATNTPFQSWIFEFQKNLEGKPQQAECVTELRANSPTQMTLTRKSAIGFTAAEIVTLGRWLESVEFPAFGVYSPAPPKRLPPRRQPGAK